ncbi:MULTISPECIES: HAD-IA family hydrolase [unclassified Paenibacillus]|uniref:HAD family hydrolase n=1 Tax=unclassified Paenibacillus TaxID=185978 RepID=UPI001AE7E03A|nr:MULTISPECIES: HAD-IA family hydrolase [unclassified Paenibacillus]MBP1155465.1 putative hydrolase of the HAD superfamily [Paenibacillus sp. PvP091]MBP1169150.1 putative hydrolase of the HAD superfamily [Paenibacillus sp. PvR098]MBP2440178.1 putative hydrolase of the HAD superfamily [Paenibacillus sp. PvP052]
MGIKAVLFDLDDTLLWDDRSVKEAFQATCSEAAKYYKVDPAHLEDAVRREARALYESYETFPFTKMIGINPFEGLWAHFSQGKQEEFRKLQALAPEYRTESWTLGLKALGIEDKELGYKLGELFPAERRNRPIVYEETFEVLDQLKERYQLLLLTNGSPDLQQEKLAGVPKLAPYFDHIVISGEFGQGKPAGAIFEHAMRLLDIQADEGVMIGDKLTTDILGSNTVGMRNMWINRHGLQRSDEIVPSHEITNLREIQTIIDSL